MYQEIRFSTKDRNYVLNEKYISLDDSFEIDVGSENFKMGLNFGKNVELKNVFFQYFIVIVQVIDSATT